MNRINWVRPTTGPMSHEKVFVVFGAICVVGTGGTAFVAILGSTAGLTGAVLVDAVAIGPTVIFVEVFTHHGAAVVVTVRVVAAVVAPVAIAFYVAVASVGQLEGKGHNVGKNSVKFGISCSQLIHESTVGSIEV